MPPTQFNPAPALSLISPKWGLAILFTSLLALHSLPSGVAVVPEPLMSEPPMPSAYDEIIRIDGNAELEAFCSIGNGTQEHPFIIENFSIDASNANATGIIIKNTNKFLTIRNCSITNGGESHTGIHLDSSENVQIINNTLTHNDIGIRLSPYSCHNVIRGNNCSHNQNYAIVISGQSNQNNISNNDCSHGGTGIYIVNESDRMLLSNNTCTFNHYNGIAILLDGWGCDILDNNCSYNGGNGLSYSDCSSSNTISGNDFSHNARHGITAWLSNNCVITENTCSYNEGSGINLVDCGGYSITHNLFSFNNDSEMNLSNQMVVVGPWFDYTLSVSGDIAIGSYSFNDTVHFQIDSTGKIANITTLSVDTYGLAIHVIDTSGNEVVGAMVVYYDGVNDPFGTPNLLPGFRIDSLLSCFGVSVLILRMILNKQRFEIKHPPNV